MTRFTRGIRFEVAKDVLAAVIVHWAEVAGQALDAANPDADYLAAIQAEQRKLRTLRDEYGRTVQQDNIMCAQSWLTWAVLRQGDSALV
jgi:hypothetical protein